MVGKRQVSPEVYDEKYFLSDSTEGYQEFCDGSVSWVKQCQIEQLELAPGIRMLEIGFGRGEFLYHCAKRGASVSAIDYSPAALTIARRTLAEFPDVDLRVADCKALPFEADYFDRVYSGDVIEHLDTEDGIQMLQEMERVLKPGGFLFIHTSPNTVFTRFVLPVMKPLLRRIDAGAVNALDEHMKINKTVHVHEYNLMSLRRVAKMAGLKNAEVWISPDILRSSRHRHTKDLSQSRVVQFAGKLGGISVFRFLLGNDLFLKYRKAPGDLAIERGKENE
jgi:ubiquinone/menaquinone biosynthesis C-methylase UbiE